MKRRTRTIDAEEQKGVKLARETMKSVKEKYLKLPPKGKAAFNKELEWQQLVFAVQSLPDL